MSRPAGWLVDQLARFLEPSERDAVRGDLAEEGVSSGRALGEIFGLVARRQADLWKTDWRPWLALFGIAIPLAIVLSGFARFTSRGSAVYFWLYWSNTRLSDFSDAGFRYSLAKDLVAAFLNCATLAAWSSTGGFVLGWLSRRATWLTAAFFLLVVGFSPLALAEVLTYTDGRAFFLVFDPARSPLSFETLLVLLPAGWGARQGARHRVLAPLRTIVWTAAAALLTARWYWGPGTHKFMWLLTLAVLSWPPVYMLFVALRRQRLSAR